VRWMSFVQLQPRSFSTDSQVLTTVHFWEKCNSTARLFCHCLPVVRFSAEVCIAFVYLSLWISQLLLGEFNFCGCLNVYEVICIFDGWAQGIESFMNTAFCFCTFSVLKIWVCANRSYCATRLALFCFDYY